MRSLLPSVCAAVSLVSCARADQTVYLGVPYDSHNSIPALGVTVGGQQYMAYFDGSQGTQVFMGNKQGAEDAVAQLTGGLNSLSLSDWGSHWQYYGVAQPPWNTAWVTNGGGTANTGSYFFEVTYADQPGERDYVQGYGADSFWIKNDQIATGESPTQLEVTFVAVPEASTSLIGLGFVSLLLTRRRR